MRGPSPSARPNPSQQPRIHSPKLQTTSQATSEQPPSQLSLPSAKRDSTDTASPQNQVNISSNHTDTVNATSEEDDSSRAYATPDSVERQDDKGNDKPIESEKMDSQKRKLVSSEPDQPSVQDKVDRFEVEKLKAEHHEAEGRWREELHGYMERIDALQSKLKYLSEDSVQSARSATGSLEPDSVERRVFEKEERIASLMEEGQKLSKLDFDNRETIKKLRRKIVEQEKAGAEYEKRFQDAQLQIAQGRDSVARLEEAARRDAVRLASLSKTEQQLASAHEERKSSNSTIADLRRQLTLSHTKASDAQRKAQAETLETERREKVRLQDDLSSARVERELSENKLRKEIGDLKATIEKDKQNSQALEAGILRERLDSEKKMELLRSQAEELSSAAGNDEQAKHLRQIETLQSQHAVALENWRVTEEYLLGRVASVEKERDELLQSESELRKKLRATVSVVLVTLSN